VGISAFIRLIFSSVSRIAARSPSFMDFGRRFVTSSSPSVISPDNLIDRARQGDQQAWQILFDDCYPKVVRVIRRRISRPLRSLYDSTDIANEVMKSLAAKFDQFDFTSINGLRAYLIRAAERKVVDGYRHGHAMKRDVTRTQAAFPGDDLGQFEVPDSGPTASQVAVATEREENLLRDQSGEERSIIELKMRGFTNNEVSKVTGWHLRKVERFLERLRGTCRL